MEDRRYRAEHKRSHKVNTGQLVVCRSWAAACFGTLLLLASLGSVAAFFAMPALAEEKTISSSDLVEKCRLYNGQEVVFQGEVIGDVMVRGDNAWISLNDDSYSADSVEEGSKLKGYNSGQSVWCKASQVKSIEHKGDYRHSGDIMRVRGVFNRACPEHGGDMDIHASQVKLVKRGHEIPHPFDLPRAVVALFLGILSGSLFLVNKFFGQREWQKREQPLNSSR